MRKRPAPREAVDGPRPTGSGRTLGGERRPGRGGHRQTLHPRPAPVPAAPARQAQAAALTGLGREPCGHRFYDLNSGRFLTRDPIGYDGGVNLYAYCANNPVNWADPSGYLSWRDIGIAIGSSGNGFNDILGGIFSLGGRYRFDPVNHVVVVHGGIKIGMVGLSGTHTFTMGDFIMTNNDANLTDQCRHELGHVDQSRYLGVRYLPVWALGSLLGIADGDKHDGNPIEIDADARCGNYNGNRYVGGLVDKAAPFVFPIPPRGVLPRH